MTDSNNDSRLTTYHGSCHCGAMRYEVDLDRDALQTNRCNCTFCTKNGWWGAILKPDVFRLTEGETPVREGVAQWVRCPECGTLVFGEGNIPELGGAFVTIGVHTLDDLDFEGLAIAWLDGRADNWTPLGFGTHSMAPWRGSESLENDSVKSGPVSGR